MLLRYSKNLIFSAIYGNSRMSGYKAGCTGIVPEVRLSISGVGKHFSADWINLNGASVLISSPSNIGVFVWAKSRYMPTEYLRQYFCDQ